MIASCTPMPSGRSSRVSRSPFGQSPTMSQSLWTCMVGTPRLLIWNLATVLDPFTTGTCGHGSLKAWKGSGAL